ncbi:hypothetical protein PWG71_27355 [Nocardiopsis sp. N85]|uniref:hypothetical protein n=1 Tax=Nocardiopsis sp. N85 TaxID=3029400 RepID=UPI00237F13F1|nr:hypothetical protein [Nocardiopsis sp. N85]MDE3725116.1 hypothetical protein [Nocardiopsis sp. N85]
MGWNSADDGEQYGAARRLDAEAGPWWTVMWAPALRAYVAFYRGREAVRWQSAPTPEGLVERLREAERGIGRDGTTPRLPVSRSGSGGAHRRAPKEESGHIAQGGVPARRALTVRLRGPRAGTRTVAVPGEETADGYWTCPAQACSWTSVNPMSHPCPVGSSVREEARDVPVGGPTW